MIIATSHETKSLSIDRPGGDIPGDCHPGYSQLSPKSNTLFQTSTISALLEGVYDGETTYKALKTATLA